MKEIFVLDACALIALMEKEPGKEQVRELYRRALSKEITLLMNRVNLLEVYYGILRSYGQQSATDLLDNVAKSPIEVTAWNDGLFEEAGRLKVANKISLADAVALAQASVSGGSLVTCDHHEFDAIERKETIKFFWIR
ncbi:MAG: type II toxin-antitoxin system VapC family toxin [Clostridia bacterium]|nr:type II toxin-antitoxin system VapC family toxin [Clostridia bacterium]